MAESLSLLPALLVGLLLGAFFFGGLRWTVSRGLTAASPALWFLGSLLLRMSVTMAGFYFVGREDWRRWLLLLAGFITARLIVNSLTRPTIQHHSARSAERGYAP